MKKLGIFLLPIIVIVLGVLIFVHSTKKSSQLAMPTPIVHILPTQTPAPNNPAATSPLAIANMRSKSYLGSQINIEQTLADGPNYHKYVASYMSDGLKIYGLLTVPIGQKPIGGWPVILLNHGYIPPSEYSTTQSYQVLVDPITQNGYIVFMPDYRGNGNSQGTPIQIYISPDYVTDSLNALASIKQYKDVNPNKIGVLGHSMGGNITLHELVLTHDIEAAVIWAGVVGSYSDIYNWWQHRVATGVLTTQNDEQTAGQVNQLVQIYKTPQENPQFWDQLDPTVYLQDVTTPLDLVVGAADEEVPPQFSENLYAKLKALGKTVKFSEYPGADHNLSPSQQEAMRQTLDFFAKYLK